jgi:hypothetical protein
MIRKRKRHKFLLDSRAGMHFSLFLMKVQSSGKQQFLDLPDQRTVGHPERRKLDVFLNQIL